MLITKNFTIRNKTFLCVIFLLSSIISFSTNAQSYKELFSLKKYSPKLELTLKGGNTRGIGRLGGIIPIVETNQGLIFTNIFGLLDSKEATEGNIGLGYRHLFDSHILGGSVFFDHRRSGSNNVFNQITLGVEYLRENFELRANGYLPFGKKRQLVASNGGSLEFVRSYLARLNQVKIYEQALHGFDVELGGNLPVFKPLSGYISYYNFNGRGLKPVHGIRFRSSLKLNEYISLEGEISHDRLREEQAGKKVVLFGGIKLNYTFGKKKERLTGLGQKMTQMIIRDVDIVSESYVKRNSGVFADLEAEHETVGIKPGAGKEERRKAYKKTSLRNHPDKGGDEEEFKKGQEATTILEYWYSGDVEGLIKSKDNSPYFSPENLAARRAQHTASSTSTNNPQRERAETNTNKNQAQTEERQILRITSGKEETTTQEDEKKPTQSKEAQEQEKRQKTQQSPVSEEITTQTKVIPSNKPNNSNTQITTISNQPLAKRTITPIVAPTKLQSQHGVTERIMPSAVEPPQVTGTFVDNFLVVNSRVRTNIQGILVSSRNNISLVSVGQEVFASNGLEEDNDRESVTITEDNLISVKPYNIIGIPNGITKEQLPKFVLANKWEVRELIGKDGSIEYKVLALGVRGRGGGKGEEEREEDLFYPLSPEDLIHPSNPEDYRYGGF